jgi:glutaconate CoA-transferase subunit B
MIFITMAMGKRAFVDKLPFITSMGHGTGGDHRARLGLKTQGPTRVMTDLCIMEPDAETRELVVTSLHPGISADKVRDACDWELRFAEVTAETPSPTALELDVLRDLQDRTARAHGAARGS